MSIVTKAIVNADAEARYHLSPGELDRLRALLQLVTSLRIAQALTDRDASSSKLETSCSKTSGHRLSWWQRRSGHDQTCLRTWITTSAVTMALLLVMSRRLKKLESSVSKCSPRNSGWGRCGKRPREERHLDDVWRRCFRSWLLLRPSRCHAVEPVCGVAVLTAKLVWLLLSPCSKYSEVF